MKQGGADSILSSAQQEGIVISRAVGNCGSQGSSSTFVATLMRTQKMGKTIFGEIATKILNPTPASGFDSASRAERCAVSASTDN